MAVTIKNNSCTFTVWAPEKQEMDLRLTADGRIIPMHKDNAGYFHCKVDNCPPGARYYYRPEKDKDYPDPASHYQPQGIHGPSEVVDHVGYQWNDNDWKGLPLETLIFYELHVGAFTAEGTFMAAVSLLDDLVATGVNAIELMPVCQFPGSRNWGYDGAFLYSVQNNYGGPEGLKKFVDACHQKGIAVFLDVVYNHVGPEGDYLPFFGPYFSDKYHTPWGKAFNYDGAWSDGVRKFIVDNVLHWAEHYHIDGLRLDAVHEIFDRNAVRIWDVLHDAVEEWRQASGRSLCLIAESDLNSPRVVTPVSQGGHGFHAQWLDDFHHALYVLLDKEGIKHYRDFGRLDQFAKAYTEGFVHSGEWVDFRKRRHGASSAGLPGHQFVVFNQNHDIPGNRPGGQRLSMLVDLPRLRLAAAALLLAPYLPMLFMGEEYGEDIPFYFFSDYEDPRLRKELKEGRKKEFEAFDWGEEPADPLDEAVFMQSKLQWHKRQEGHYKEILEWHRSLIALRKRHPLLTDLSRQRIRADLFGTSGLAVHRHNGDNSRQLLCLFNFSEEQLDYSFAYPGEWTCILSSHDPVARRNIPVLRLPPWSVTVYDLGETSTTTLRSATFNELSAG
ncbi:malto-oligosyltrehalose trehalohydrolase [Flavitalea sp. BT771]|uniref:malto-oligosyltrehalose trehalohydrolase n=1 Tax=Flavitalea sp. BT771 TaxID=3063329 RepID=UPI0026E1584E|nr:malto-oligosyltrehalose trehalohydrolase [Flavitalea sp. BT771]MDO6430532.1 malto-oligosyltrehalose trehalohydrolase [Flavitalea sp. BT771]MDV6219328.1 malto-oligosyltrehalose trehalohydrolase [Flavitalea sp. BT771]